MNEELILAIESSCDETSVAVVRNGTEILSNIVASQINSHKRFGGVVPEVASRHHVEQITLCLEDALVEAGVSAEDLSAVAVTYGPGLVGSLLIGISAAKAFAWAHQLPLIPVNHMAGHIYAARLVKPFQFPLMALLVSGGHTELVYMQEDGSYEIIGETRDDAAGEAYDKVGPVNHMAGHIYAARLVKPFQFPLMALLVSGGPTELVYMQEDGSYEIIGETRDDAAGEAYDKVGRVLGLSYPSGKEIDQLAHQGKDNYHFPRAMIHEDNYDFSFSGLKSAFINLVHNAQQRGEDLDKNHQGKDNYHFPRAMIHEDNYDFSFSGLKSAFINLVHNAQQRGEDLDKNDLAASFQASVIDVLITKTLRACQNYPVKQLIVAGGVAANQGLREGLQDALATKFPEVELVIPPLRLCGDNAAMIGAAAHVEMQKRNFASYQLNADPSLVLSE